MVKYKGRLGFKQYMPMKPVKRVPADATNGFVSTMQVYTGKNDGGQPENGLGHCVICNLVSNLKGKNYHIFCDNFFTSVWLAKDWLSDKLYLCGTTHASRTDFSKDLKANKPEVKSLRHGESVFRRKGKIVASMWKDKKAVAFISTHCNARGNKTIHRKQKDGTYIEVPSLLVVKPYNQYMGGVDHSDQMRQYYDTSRQANKWWRYLL